MKQSIFFIFLAYLVLCTTSLPLQVTKDVPISGENIESVNDSIKEDNREVFAMILEVNKGLESSEIYIDQGDIMKSKGRFALKCVSCIWPKSADGTVRVPYTFDSRYNTNEQNLFMSAMQEYESLTCVRFVKRTTENNYLSIKSSSGCVSSVGFIGGAQSVQLLAPGCMFKGIIQHELNHALGFLHENSRPDRDKYIIIHYENIAPGSEPNFAIAQGNTLSLPYDYESVMHFSSYAFSNGSKSTIEPTPDPNVPIGQRNGISVLDVAKIKKLYNCNVCSTLLNAPNGSFSYNNYLSYYPNNTNCVWLIRIPSAQVSLTFNDFNIRDSYKCTSDYMKIYDGPSRSSPILLDKICGRIQIPTIIGSNNQMLIELVSGNITPTMGFNASYNTVSCGGTFFTKTNEFTSPGYSSGSYQSNINCNYMIYAPTGYRILLNGTYDIQSTPYCSKDRLTVYGNGVVAHPTYIYCGIGTFQIKSVSDKMLLNFQTDIYIQKRGFIVTYSIESAENN